MKVQAKDDNIRKIIKHPVAGAFREDGTADWPDDTYTHRRINDGDVTVIGEAKTPQQELAQPVAEEEQQPSPKSRHK